MKQIKLIAFSALLACSSTPSFAQWQQIATTKDESVYDMTVDGSTILAVGFGPVVFKSTDNGATWSKLGTTGISGTSALYSSAIQGSTIFAGGQNGNVYKSTNNGSSWAKAITGMTGAGDVLALKSSGSNLYAGKYNDGFFRSTDAGASWTSLKSNQTVNTILEKGSMLFIGCESSTILMSADNGSTWVNRDSNIWAGGIYSFIADGNTLYAGTYGGHVFKSDNDGVSWTEFPVVKSGSEDVNGLAVNGPNVYVGTRKEGVYLSTNSGTSWKGFNTGIANKFIYTLKIVGSNIFAGTYDGIYKRSLTDLVSGIAGAAELATQFSVYPNPTSGKVAVEYEAQAGVPATYELTDMLGNTLLTGVSDKSFELDLSGCNSGMYLLKVLDEGVVTVRRIVKR